MMAAAVPMRPGQIYPVQPGNNGAHLEDTIEDAMWAAAGKLSIAAGWLGMTRRALEGRIANSERLNEVAREIREMRVDIAEDRLDALVQSGNDKAVVFLLKSQGKSRGYAETKEVRDPNSLTLDAARELETRLVSAFEQIRKQAVDATIAKAQQPAIESRPAVEIDASATDLEIEVQAGGPISPGLDDDEMLNADF
jgi:hypothetical protein